jgi:hypothetical protein
MTAGLAELERRVACQETAEDARTLVSRYASACDTHDLGQIGAMFATDAVVSVPNDSWIGLDEVRRFYREAWAASPGPSRHFITNVAMSDLQQSRVDVTAYLLYVTATGDGVSQIGWGSYRDRYARQGDRLVVQSKHIVLDLVVDVREGWAEAMHRVAAMVSG